jgi:hypothetical protein
MTMRGLASLRMKALRQRVWFALSQVERDIVSLTLRYVEEIKSVRLSLVINRIVLKILEALRSPFLQKVERVGCDFIERIRRIAVGWGYVQASVWLQDLGFVRYLGIMAVNDTGGQWRS